MTQLYFDCSSPQGVLLDQSGVIIDDLTEARDRATCIVRSLTMGHWLDDWRGWVLHVRDDLGDELFVVPFTFVIGKPH